MMLVVVQLSTGKKVVMKSNLGMLNPGSGANSIWVTDYSARLYEAGASTRPLLSSKCELLWDTFITRHKRDTKRLTDQNGLG
jgi:hypothetical protein